MDRCLALLGWHGERVESDCVEGRTESTNSLLLNVPGEPRCFMTWTSLLQAIGYYSLNDNKCLPHKLAFSTKTFLVVTNTINNEYNLLHISLTFLNFNRLALFVMPPRHHYLSSTKTPKLCLPLNSWYKQKA